MRTNTFKKITIIFLATFLFGFVLFTNIVLAAPRLTIESTTINLESGKDTLITAKVTGLINKLIFFKSSPSEGTIFSPTTCTTSPSGDPSFCFVSFKSTNPGEFNISASTNYNRVLTSNTIKITITKENVSPKCEPPKALDWFDRCVDCPDPNIIVKGRCEKKLTTADCESLNRTLNSITNKCDCISPKIVDDNGDCKNPNTVPLTNNNTTKDTNTTYTPLAPLPGLGETGCKDENGVVITDPKTGEIIPCIETSKNKVDCPFGNYLNIIIKLVLGIAGVLAMVMIVMGGIQYMTSDLVSSKGAGKETIQHAILGLLIALGAYLILNTINPQLLTACLDKLPQATITVGGPESGDNTIDPDFAKGLRIYSTGTISPRVSDAVKKLSAGWKISKFTIHAKANGMTIELMKGTESNYDAYISISPGYGGYATTGSAVINDHKTPYGDWKIIGINYTPGQAQFNKKGSNMGAAFWLLSPMTSGERGIGIHGNKAGTLGTTNGCIRLQNADILALEPYITTGIPVSVVD